MPDGLRDIERNDLSILGLPGCSDLAVEPAVLSDRDVLVALYHATDGANWKNNWNWLSDEPIRFWHGVSADRGDKVTILNLGANNLNGTIPSAIGQLSELSGLILDNNDLTGELPPELGNLENLVMLSVAENSLRGPIPSELGNLRFLRELILHKNQLSGDIPRELGGIGSLLDLRLDFNRLTGSLPGSWAT